MKLKRAIEILGTDAAIQTAKNIAKEQGLPWDEGACFVFSAIANDMERTPGNIGGNNGDEKAVIEKWLRKYQRGYDGRASQRISNPPGTVADPVIEKIIGARLINLSQADLNKITFAHRLGMSAENILGLILEEFLAVHLKAHGWHCAWGETVKSVDFVHENGSLLQIKNSSSKHQFRLSRRNLRCCFAQGEIKLLFPFNIASAFVS